MLLMVIQLIPRPHPAVVAAVAARIAIRVRANFWKVRRPTVRQS